MEHDILILDSLYLRSTGCDYATVERVNRDTVYPLLAKLAETAFMRFFKVYYDSRTLDFTRTHFLCKNFHLLSKYPCIKSMVSRQEKWKDTE